MGAITKTFKSGNSVAVRLPRETGLEAGVEVEIETSASAVVIRRRPTSSPRDLIEALARLPKANRPMAREKIVFPKRRGL